MNLTQVEKITEESDTRGKKIMEELQSQKFNEKTLCHQNFSIDLA